MNLSNLSSFYSKFGDYAKDFAGEVVKYSPKILTYLGVAGIFGTAIVSYKTYPKVEAIVEEHNNIVKVIFKDNRDVQAKLKKEKWRFFKELVKAVGPALAMSIISSACVICADAINTRRISILSAAYAVAEKRINDLEDYKNKVRDVVGNKKADLVDKAHDENDVLYPVKAADVYETGHGHMLCFDKFSGRYFRCNPGYIRNVFKDLNWRLCNEHWITVNEYYAEIDMEANDAGDILGWDLEEMGQINPTISTFLATVDGVEEPCTVVSFDFCMRHHW